MFVLKYNSFDFDQQLMDIAENVTTHHYGRKVEIKDSIATGYYKVLKFPNGLKAVITNYVLNQDFVAARENVSAEYYLLHLNLVKAGQEFMVSMNQQEVDFGDQIFSSVFLTYSKEPYGIRGSKGACFSQLKIVIPKNWLAQDMVASFQPERLETYFGLGETRLSFDSMDPGYRSLVDKVMNTQDNVYYLAITQSIITLIVERFMEKMRRKLENRAGDMDLIDQVA
jgi:hypothetical protein